MGKPKKLCIICKQAKMGKPHQMYALAILYYEGTGVEEDTEKALYWMNLAADAGYAPALAWLEELPLTGRIAGREGGVTILFCKEDEG